MSIIQMGSGVINVSIALIIAIVIIIRSSVNMIEKKRIFVFVPFFLLGFAICLTAAFMVNDFFGLAVDSFYVMNFVSVVGIFFVLWKVVK